MNSKRPAEGAHPLKPETFKPENPTILDSRAAEQVRKSLHTKVDTIVNMREGPHALLSKDLSASLFQAALGDDAFEALTRCAEGDRLSQLIALVRIGGTITAGASRQTGGRVQQIDAFAIEQDLLSLYHRQGKDGPPAWLLPRGKERSNATDLEHQRRAVVWQRFIATARESSSTGTNEVSDFYGVTDRTVMSWTSQISGDPVMERRLAEAEGYLKEGTGERISAIFEESLVRIVWMKQRDDVSGRGKPGHYRELLTAQANEYRALKGKKLIYLNQ